MSGVDEPTRAPRTLYTFNSRSALQGYAKGCDVDIGGTSTVNLTLDESEPQPTGKFWGDMRLAVRPELRDAYEVDMLASVAQYLCFPFRPSDC